MKALTEFVGTFIFLFAISLAAIGGSPLAPFAIGGTLMCMVYMGGHISGAHYNPAVSTAVLLQKKISFGDYISYVIAQIVAGIAAFGLGWYITNRTVSIHPSAEITPVKAIIIEAIFTMALALVVLNVAVSKKTEGKGFYGLAIGITIIAAVIAAGPLSGGVFNPAVGIGATVIDAMKGGGTYDDLMIYIVGPLVGGIIGSLIFSMQEKSSAQTA